MKTEYRLAFLLITTDERERSSWVAESSPETCDAEALAGRSADEDVDFRLTVFLLSPQPCHVAEVRHVRGNGARARHWGRSQSR
jgi:hypothetical protein